MAANVQEVRDTIRECLEDVFTCEDVHRNIGHPWNATIQSQDCGLR